MQDKLKLSVTKYGSIFCHCHISASVCLCNTERQRNKDKSNIGRKGGSHTGTIKYINIHTVTNVKKQNKKHRKYTIAFNNGCKITEKQAVKS